MRRVRGERGAAAVELAIVFPLLILLIAGIIDLGRLLFAQVMLSNAAREGARMVAMGQHPNAEARALASMPMFDELANGNNPAVVDPGVACPNGDNQAVVSVSATDFDWLMLGFTGIGAPQPEAEAVMRCGG